MRYIYVLCFLFFFKVINAQVPSIAKKVVLLQTKSKPFATVPSVYDANRNVFTIVYCQDYFKSPDTTIEHSGTFRVLMCHSSNGEPLWYKKLYSLDQSITSSIVFTNVFKENVYIAHLGADFNFDGKDYIKSHNFLINANGNVTAITDSISYVSSARFESNYNTNGAYFLSGSINNKHLVLLDSQNTAQNLSEKLPSIFRFLSYDVLTNGNFIGLHSPQKDTAFFTNFYIENSESKRFLDVIMLDTNNNQYFEHFGRFSAQTTLSNCMVKSTDDGGFIISGVFESDSLRFNGKGIIEGGVFPNIFLVKMKQDGSIVWVKRSDQSETFGILLKTQGLDIRGSVGKILSYFIKGGFTYDGQTAKDEGGYAVYFNVADGSAIQLQKLVSNNHISFLDSQKYQAVYNITEGRSTEINGISYTSSSDSIATLIMFCDSGEYKTNAIPDEILPKPQWQYSAQNQMLQVSYNSPNYTLTVTGIDGRVLVNKQVNSYLTNVQMTAIKPQVYLITVYSNGKSSTVKAFLR